MAIQISPSDSATAVEEVVGVVMQCQMILIPGGRVDMEVAWYTFSLTT